MRLVIAAMISIALGCYDCQTKTELKGLVIKHSYAGSVVIDTVYLEKELRNDSIIYRKTFKGQNRITQVRVHEQRRDVLDYMQGRSKVTNTKEFEGIYGQYRVYKFLFDEEASSDEEEVLFFCDKYGVIFARWLGEGMGTSFEYDEISTALVQQILTDTTDFYIDKIPPPPVIPNKDK